MSRVLTGTAPIAARHEEGETMEAFHARVYAERLAVEADLRLIHDVDGAVGRFQPNLSDDLRTLTWRFITGAPRPGAS